MAIVVKPLSKSFKVELSHEEEKVVFTFKQLTYKVKSEITGMVTRIQGGQLVIDATLQVFYNIKYGLKKVEGINDEAGVTYDLEFEDKTKECLTDECVDALLSCVLSDNLQYTARQLTDSVLPSEILHPITNKKIEGIEIIPSENVGVKKKS